MSVFPRGHIDERDQQRGVGREGQGEKKEVKEGKKEKERKENKAFLCA